MKLCMLVENANTDPKLDPKSYNAPLKSTLEVTYDQKQISKYNIFTFCYHKRFIIDLNRTIMKGSRISRRDFLKLLLQSGSSVVLFAMFGFGGFYNTLFKLQSPSGNRSGNIGSAITAGSWSSSSNSVDVAIHAALLGNGKVFYLAGSGFHRDQVSGPYKHAIWDPANNTHTQYTLSEDLFCCGMTTLPSGNILLAGGTLEYDMQNEE
jgi:hypothetical protein